MSSELEEPQIERRILQIVQSADYCVIYFDAETGEPWADNIICWALVEDRLEAASGQSKTRVVGLVADGAETIAVDELPNFVGYMPPTDSMEQWRDASYDAWKEWRESGSENNEFQPKRQNQPRS